MLDEIRSEPATMDAAWMPSAMQACGVADGASVTEVEFAGYIGTGQAARTARLQLTWDAGDRPSSVIAKIPSDDESARAANFGAGRVAISDHQPTGLVGPLDGWAPTSGVMSS